jgi:hypothetical protein
MRRCYVSDERVESAKKKPLLRARSRRLEKQRLLGSTGSHPIVSRFRVGIKSAAFVRETYAKAVSEVQHACDWYSLQYELELIAVAEATSCDQRKADGRARSALRRALDGKKRMKSSADATDADIRVSRTLW